MKEEQGWLKTPTCFIYPQLPSSERPLDLLLYQGEMIDDPTSHRVEQQVTRDIRARHYSSRTLTVNFGHTQVPD